MEMEFDSLDSDESWQWSVEKSEKISEAHKDRQSKSLQGIKKIQKDEKKAKKDNDALFRIIAEMIRLKHFDPIILDIVRLLDEGVPSGIIVGLVSLVYKNASDIIRADYSHKKPISFEYVPPSQSVDFNDETLPEEVKKRINEWIEDIFDVVTADPSHVLIHKLNGMITRRSADSLRDAFASVLVFFFSALGIDFQWNTAKVYAEFILSQVQKRLSLVDHLDVELLSSQE